VKPTRLDARDLKPILDIDRTIHTPARLMILALLHVVERADFTFLMNQTGLTRGNLSTHLDKLAEEGYIEVTKTFENGKIPRTLVGLTEAGRLAVRTYRENMRQVIDELLG